MPTKPSAHTGKQQDQTAPRQEHRQLDEALVLLAGDVPRGLFQSPALGARPGAPGDCDKAIAFALIAIAEQLEGSALN